MLGLDEWWEIDATFMHWLLGEDSAAGIKQAWATRCTSVGQVANLDMAMTNSKELLLTASRFACHATRCELGVCDKMLANLKAGDKLMATTAVSQWVMQMATALEDYIVWRAPNGGGSGSASASAPASESEELRGHAAFTAMMAAYEKSPPKALEDLKWCSVFRHKLSASQLQMVSKWRDDLMKPLGGGASEQSCIACQACRETQD